MDSTKKLAKDVLTILKDNQLEMSPENYFKEFKKQASFSKITIKELKLFDEIINTLTNEERDNSSSLESFNDLAQILSKRASNDELKNLLNILNDVLSPSIDFTKTNEIDVFIDDLIKEPKKILTKDILKKIQDMSKERINADRMVLRKKTDDIIKITTLMEKYFQKSLIESSNSTSEVQKIKTELNDLNISESSFREVGILQSKLVDTIFNIEHTLEKNHTTLNNHKSKFKEMHKTIEKLQEELSTAKEEKSIDYLTNILNRRAFKEEVIKIEKKHAIFNSNYVLIFIDIDHFKDVNDTYGHECGDTILKSFASILKKLTRQEDVLCRYGGEEFISLLNYRNKEEIITYLNRLKRILKTNYFLFKNNEIHLRFSAGVAFRDNYSSYEDTKKSADLLLYKAKNNGRDKIIFDDGTEL